MFFFSGIGARRVLAGILAASAACAGTHAGDMLPVTANDVLALPVHSPFAGGAAAVDSATLSATVALAAGKGNVAPARMQTLRDRLALLAATMPRGETYPAGTLDRSERLRSPGAAPAAPPFGAIGVTLPRDAAHADRIGVHIALSNTVTTPGTVILTPLGQAPGR
ncbi:hypothetical protein HH212_19335 [Massilia forsythiae]|uniref:Uncharacterized protein n=1 Tax=Massilia forsythiae TaxID=2728020 RepID=A0A7Z2VYU0_9BURK|nr:hypothetical protein [Massilia forsythiae]QJE01907.1 hypothetical protein HH212_19335 [Massilia forsythiae]